jgi:tRNA(Ile)-lysidine synthase
MQQLAELDWQRVGRDSAIVIAELRKLNPDRQVNLLRYWMQQQAHYLPNAKALQQLLSQLAEAKTDSRIRLDWGDWRVEQSAELLYFVPADDVEPFQYHWQSFPAPLHLKPLALALQVQALSNESLKKGHLGVRPPNADEQVVVRSRRGGEKCWPDYRERATELKKVFQELNLPRWQRDRVPLVFYNDQLVAAVGLFCDRRFASKSTDAIVFELTKASHHR